MSDVNLTPSLYSHWNTAVAAARAGSANARLHFIGDSTTLGTYAAAFSAGYPYQLETLLEVWMPAQHGTIWCDGDYNTASYVSWQDSRVTKGSGWLISNLGTQPASKIQGQGGWYAPSGTAAALAFAPGYSFNTIKIYFAGSPANGTATVNVDGGASLGTLNTVLGATGISSQTFSCSAGVHTINIQNVTTAAVYVLGIEATLSTAKKVLASNGGAGGALSANWVDTATTWFSWFTLNTFSAPDLAIISLGVNDNNASVTKAAYKANISTLIDRCQLTGDVLLCSPVPVSTGATLQPQYQAALEELAVTKNCGVVDLNLAGRFVNYATANGNGYMADVNHPNATGYAFWAGIMNTAVQEITSGSPLNPARSGLRDNGPTPFFPFDT